MKFSFAILLFAFQALAVLSSRVIEIHFDERNFPIFSNVTLPGISPWRSDESDIIPPMNASISLNDRSEVHIGWRYRYNATLNSTILYGQDLLLSSRATSSFVAQFPGIMVEIGIGPGAYLLNEYGSISVVRSVSSDSGLLILNDPLANNFTQFCTPGSVVRVPFHRHEGHESVQAAANLEVRALWPLTGSESVYAPASPTPIAPRRSSRNLIALPQSLVDAINSVMQISGAVASVEYRDSDFHYMFRNCTLESVLNQLPEIKLVINGSGSEIKLLPEDYLHWNRETNECEKKFTPFEFGYRRFFDILAIPQTNLHITADSILICDAL